MRHLVGYLMAILLKVADGLLAQIFCEESGQLGGKLLPCLALTHGDLENVGQVIGSETTSLQEEESSMDSLPCDVLGILLQCVCVWVCVCVCVRERERERVRERERERERE